MATVSLYSPNWEPYSSYGIISSYLLYYLSQKGIHVNPFSVINEDGHVVMKYPEQSDVIHELLENTMKPTVGGIVLGYPTLMDQYGPLLEQGPMVLITGWESTKMPNGWVEAFHHPNLKAIIVWSEWNKQMMIDEGVKTPIYVVPLGINDIYQYYRRPARKVYRFLTVGDRHIRKGWDLAVKAFAKAFGERDDVELIIKTRDMGNKFGLVYPLGDGLMTWDGKRFEYAGQKINTIRIVDEDLDEFEMYELYKSVDCVVSLYRGEGFGWFAREMVATGGKAIVTKWGADDYESWAYGVDYEMVPAWQGHRKFEGLGEWAEADVDHAAKQMLHLVKQERTNVQYSRYNAEQSARRVRKLCDWQRFIDEIWAIWERVSQPETIEDKVAAYKRRKKGIKPLSR